MNHARFPEGANARTPSPGVEDTARSESLQPILRKVSQTALDVSAPQRGRPLVRGPEEASPVDGELPQRNDSRHGHIPYVENGARWMEKQEAHSLRKALEDMDLHDEKLVHEAAQKEASELVLKHQNPNAERRNAETPYRYTEHLRKGSHIRSPSWIRAQNLQQSMSKRRDLSGNRSVSGGSRTDSSNSSRIPSDSSLKVPESPLTPSEDDFAEQKEKKRLIHFAEPSQEKLASEPSQSSRTLGPMRKTSKQSSPSGEPSSNGSTSEEIPQPRDADTKRRISWNRGIVKQDDVKVSSVAIAARLASNAVPLHFRNPFARLRSTKGSSITRANTDPLPETKKLDRVEIQRNPPSQSKDPLYTTNQLAEPTLEESRPVKEEVNMKMKDGKEVRSDDIRKATSMSLRDRSSKLPTPSMVSDSPGRPIVSFDPNWRPAEAEPGEEVSSAPPNKPELYPSIRPQVEQE